MVDNNRDRSHIAMRTVYTFVEYVFFISLRSYHMLLLSCRLHKWRPRRLAHVAMRKSVRNLIFIAVMHPITMKNHIKWLGKCKHITFVTPPSYMLRLNWSSTQSKGLNMFWFFYICHAINVRQGSLSPSPIAVCWLSRPPPAACFTLCEF
jgi:hypothetical protein